MCLVFKRGRKFVTKFWVEMVFCGVWGLSGSAESVKMIKKVPFATYFMGLWGFGGGVGFGCGCKGFGG